MYGLDVNENDWKYFRSRLSAWADIYYTRRNEEYMQILTGPGTAAKKSDMLYRQMREDRKDEYHLFDLRRSTMKQQVMMLYARDIIPPEDFEHFSEELKQNIIGFLRSL